MPDTGLPPGAITAAAKNITAFLLGCGWTRAEAKEVAPRLADNVLTAAVPYLHPAETAIRAKLAEALEHHINLRTDEDGRYCAGCNESWPCPDADFLDGLGGT